MNPVKLGLRIRHAREQKGLSQEDFAVRINKDQRAVSEYENGKRRMPVTDLPLIARSLDVPIMYFFEDELTPEDLDYELLTRFHAIDSPKKRRAAVDLLSVFADAINEDD